MKLKYAIPVLLLALYSNNKSVNAAESEKPDATPISSRNAEHDPDIMQRTVESLESRVLNIQLREIKDAADKIVAIPLKNKEKGLDFAISAYEGAAEKMYQLMVDPKLFAKGAVIRVLNNSRAVNNYKEAINCLREGNRNKANSLISESEKYILATSRFLEDIENTTDEELNVKYEDLEEVKAICNLKKGEEKNNRTKALAGRITERIKSSEEFQRYSTRVQLYAQPAEVKTEEPTTAPAEQTPFSSNRTGIEVIVLDSFDVADESNANWDIDWGKDTVSFDDNGTWHVGLWGNEVCERSITSKTDLKQEGVYEIVVEWSIANYEKGVFSIEMTDGRNTRLLKRGPGVGGPYLLRVDINEHNLATTFVDGKREGVVDLNNLTEWHIRFNTKAGEGHFVIDVDEVSYQH